MSDTPARKAPVTMDPASAPPRPQQQQQHLRPEDQRSDRLPDQRQDERPEQRQDPRAEQRQDPRQDQRMDERQGQRLDERAEQRSAQPTHHQSPQPPQHEARQPAGRLEDEWQAVQYEFVDDPKAAVRKADELVKRAIEELTTRHRSLSKQLEGNGDPQTEDLRLALHRYRELFKSLVAAK